jgi:hypothetical protein
MLHGFDPLVEEAVNNMQNTLLVLKETITKLIVILLLIIPKQNTLLGSPSLTSEYKKIKEIKCTISPHKNTMKSIKTPNAHNRSSKAFFIIHKMLLQIVLARFTMRT